MEDSILKPLGYFFVVITKVMACLAEIKFQELDAKQPHLLKRHLMAKHLCSKLSFMGFMVNSHFVHTLDIAPVKFAATSANVRLNSCGAALCLRVSELSLRCTGENYNFNATALGSEQSFATICLTDRCADEAVIGIIV